MYERELFLLSGTTHVVPVIRPAHSSMEPFQSLFLRMQPRAVCNSLSKFLWLLLTPGRDIQRETMVDGQRIVGGRLSTHTW